MFLFKEMLRRALEHVTSDESFNIAVEPAATALKAAKNVLQWASQEENKSAFSAFEKTLVTELNTCLPKVCKGVLAFRVQRVELWRSFHNLRTSEHFKKAWCEFLSQTRSDPVPTLYQEVSDLVFEELLISAHPLEADNKPKEITQVSYEDANVIRYIAGYVCRKVNDKIETLSCSEKPNLKKCLTGLLEEEGESAATASVDWTDAVDRGGLWHVREGTYMFFSAMEVEVREYLHINMTQKDTEAVKESVIDAIATSEDVLFHWAMLSAETEEEDAKVVFDMIVNLWVTVRGFGFTSAWLELYKREKKKSLQRSKALRRGMN